MPRLFLLCLGRLSLHSSLLGIGSCPTVLPQWLKWTKGEPVQYRPTPIVEYWPSAPSGNWRASAAGQSSWRHRAVP